MTNLTKQQIQQRIDELQPWHFCLSFPFGLTTGTSLPDHYEKIDVMTQAGAFARPTYRRVLDLGANSGIVSMWFADNKQSQVVAVEGGSVFFEQLEFAVEQKGYQSSITAIKANIIKLDAESLDPAEIGYDCVLLLGVLHHIPEKSRQNVVNLCYSLVNHLGEVYIQTKEDIGAEQMMKEAGFLFIERICDWPGQNRVAWRARKDPMKL